MEKQLAEQRAEADLLNQRSRELEARLADQARLLAQRTHQVEQVTFALGAAQTIEADLRAELVAVAAGQVNALQTLKHEKAQLQGQLDQANEERTKLQRDLAGIKRDTEANSASERVENALLRERITDIAAEIARLTATLEGNSSPIDEMLTQHLAQTHGRPPTHKAEAAPAPTLIPMEAGGNLADRMRALQSRARSVTTPS